MATFVGSYTNKIDRKGRTSVPARFRAAVEKQDFRGVILAPSLDLGAIDGCDHERIVRVAEGLDDPDLYSPEERDLATRILAKSEEILLDQEGRILLPGGLRELAGLTAEALFVGIGPTFQIWEPGRYAEHQGKAETGLVNLRNLPVPRRVPARPGEP
jgi:MraZ protein